MYQRVQPVPADVDINSDVMRQFMEDLRRAINQPLLQSSAVNPTATNIDPSSYLVWKNTASGEVRLWVNDNGTLKSVLLT